MSEVRHILIGADKYEEWVIQEKGGVDPFPNKEEVWVNPYKSEEWVGLWLF